MKNTGFANPVFFIYTNCNGVGHCGILLIKPGSAKKGTGFL
jgi:hypothetical protein